MAVVDHYRCLTCGQMWGVGEPEVHDWTRKFVHLVAFVTFGKPQFPGQRVERPRLGWTPGDDAAFDRAFDGHLGA